MSASVTVYTIPSCPQCTATKRALTKRGVAFQEVDLTTDENARETLKAEGFMSAPVVITDNDSWTGFRPDKIQSL